MNLKNKKQLASRTFGVGESRILFINSRKDEIKEAITKQDIRDLVGAGAIVIKEIKGRRSKLKKKKGGVGSIKKRVNRRKQDYVIMTRKLRAFSKAKNKLGELDKKELEKIRKKIRNKDFKSKAHLIKYFGELKK